MQEKYRAGAFGKLILVGEHSVVYGQPAISMAFKPVSSLVSIEESSVDYISSDLYQGELESSPSQVRGIKELVKSLKDEFNIDKALKIIIDSSIPIGKGMGSSAGVSIALIRAFYKYMGRLVKQEELIYWSNISEKIIHGNPSGLDAQTIISEQSLYYIKPGSFERLDFKLDAYLLVCDSGIVGDTKKAIRKVEDYLKENDPKGKSIIELGRITDYMRLSIEQEDKIAVGQAMNQAQEVLVRLGLSNQTLDTIISICTERGALGAKITGAGLGGCCLALLDSYEDCLRVSRRLEREGFRVWNLSLGGNEND